jgi:cullin 1
MLKAKKSLKGNKKTVGHYLHGSSEQKLLKKVQYELLMQCKPHLLGLDKPTALYIPILKR